MNAKYRITSTWSISPNYRLENLISFGSDTDPTEKSSYEGEIPHMINDDNFVKLDKTDCDEGCCISIMLEDPCIKIVKFSVVSEVRLIEFYGSFGEYIGTHECTLLGNNSEALFYNAQPNITQTKEITIKFVGKKDSCWVYGIKLLVQEVPATTTFFDCKSVEEMLKSSKVPISEKAEKAKKFLSSYSNKIGSSSSITDPQMLLRMMEGEYMSRLKPVGEAGKSVTKYISNLIMTKMKNEDQEELDLKQYVDQSILRLEERVQKSISQQLQEFEMKQNEKLDSIIELLSKT